MKKISEHLGQIIIALVGVALLIAAVMVFRSPTGNFYDSVIDQETLAGDEILGSIENIDLNISPSDSDDLLYSVGILSDIHLASYNSSNKANKKFINALQFFNDYGCTATFISGDITQSGTDAEFAKFVELRDQYKGDMQVFTATGNHEASSSRTYSNKITENSCIAYNIYDLVGNHQFFYVENGKYTYWDISPGNYTVDSAQNVTVYDSSIVIPGDDVYIFLGILGDANGGLFWDESLQWIYETFDANKDKRCFVFEHCRAERLVYDTSVSAYVDDTYKSFVSGNTAGLYLKTLWYAPGEKAKTMESLFAHYTNIVWFHGHTHQSANRDYHVGTPGYSIANVDSFFGNAYNMKNPSASAANTEWTWSVHVPSCANIRTGVNGSWETNNNHSEGLIVDVYQEKVVLRYVHFTEDNGETFINEFYEDEVYVLDTTLDQIGKYTPTTSLVAPK